MSANESVHDLVVRRRDQLAQDVVRLTLACPDGGEVPFWEPGAHIDLVLGGGLVRQYSLCGDVGDRAGLQVAVLREPAGRGGSVHVHDRLAEGDRVQVRGPRNNFSLVDSPEYLFIAGGIGITPLMPMIRRVEAAGAEWTLLYGGRTRSSMAFLDELAGERADRVRIQPQDEFGLLDLESVLGEPRDGVAVYCCGPEPLLEAVEKLTAPWPQGSLHLERFSPKTLQDAPEPGAFVVKLARTGTEAIVPADRSIADVLGEAGVDLPTSCLEGTCGTCETAVLEGRPDHRDSLLSEDERRQGKTMMPCVSRCLSPTLVLDL
ncbi:PDR/VanB family oxidoreductase [Streptomyces viridosporus]|uniref:PDR/VanB family oxidoreductase n=1 Tax=Streptomyces viridosporus TaxID=67581 RepID=UPI001C3FD69C|nr:PDR/VanB family oxidoreductase [Streptomyces viridosporus]